MNPLIRLIAEEIRENGPIPFRRFMELALYHPELGYYRRAANPFGSGGDFFTNSQLQPVFGRLIAQQIEVWREEMGGPDEFTVVELGAGRGETGAEIRQLLPGIRYIEVDIETGEIPSSFQGVVFSNEFFDALPVHSVERGGEGWVEQFVDAAGDRFEWREGNVSDSRIEQYANRYCPEIAEGQKVEVNLGALDHLETISRALRRGYILTIDYGYLANEIAGGRRLPAGSLMSYERHQPADDVLANPGERDITAHVNFTALIEHGGELGLKSPPLRTQAEFLLSIGERDHFAAALAAESESRQLELRMQLKTLLFGLGESFRVLVQSR
jgi:SAM-dependent MidA family methyltransferase